MGIKTLSAAVKALIVSSPSEGGVSTITKSYLFFNSFLNSASFNRISRRTAWTNSTSAPTRERCAGHKETLAEGVGTIVVSSVSFSRSTS